MSNSLDLETALRRTLDRSAALRRRQHRGRAARAVAVVSVLALVTGLVLAIHPNGHSPQRTRAAGSPHWTLVSDVVTNWRVQPFPGSGLPTFSMACPSTTTCLVSGSDEFAPKGQIPTDQIEVTTDSGATWSTASLPVTLTVGASVSCPSITFCAVLGADQSGQLEFLTSADQGQTWTTEQVPTTGSQDSFNADLSCPTVTSCAAVVTPVSEVGGGLSIWGHTPFAISSTDAGATWSTATFPTSFSASPGSLSCTAAGDCVAAGSLLSGPNNAGAAYSTDGGATWSVSSVPADAVPLAHVNCTSGGLCMATAGLLRTAGGIYVSTNSGASWSAAAGAGLVPLIMPSFWCTDASDCWVGGVVAPVDAAAVQVDAAQPLIAESTDQGASWQPATLPANVHGVVALTCPTATVCDAIAIVTAAQGQPAFGLLTDAPAS